MRKTVTTRWWPTFTAGPRVAVTWWSGFFNAHAPQSMTRMVSYILCLTVATSAGVTFWFAFLHPTAAETVKYLTWMVVGITTGGIAALLGRTKAKDLPVPSLGGVVEQVTSTITPQTEDEP